VRYAGGRPLWHLSLSRWDASGKPVSVLRWSATALRQMEAIRDRIMRGLGTDEPWVVEHMGHVIGDRAIAMHYRRPLRIEEVNQMARTPETIMRPGRA
jgi:hypothetical protein